MATFLFRLTLICLAGTGIFAVYSHFDVEAKKAELAIEKPALETLRTKLENVEADIDTANEEISILEEEIARKQTAAANKTDVPTLEAERDKLWNDFAEHVQKVRNNFVGTELPTLTLENGQNLQGVKVQKMAGDGMTLVHSQGIVKVPLAGLSADLKGRFRVGMSPPDPKVLPGGDVPVPGTASTPAFMAAAATSKEGMPPSEPPLTMAQKERIAKLQTQINAYVVQRADMERTKAAYMRQANNYREKDGLSILRGQRPRYANIIPRIDAATQELMGRIGEVTVRVADLQIAMENIKTEKK